MKKSITLAVLALTALLTGCATPSYDYTAFRESKPRSILVLPFEGVAGGIYLLQLLQHCFCRLPPSGQQQYLIAVEILCTSKPHLKRRIGFVKGV